MAPHLYIHVPFCQGGKCCYCGLYSVAGTGAEAVRYASLPAAETRLLPEGVSTDAEPVQTVYIGGGTPAALGRDGLNTLVTALAARLPLAHVTEWTVELHPALTDAALLETLAALGVNRLSIGVQSLDDATLARLGRRHSAEAAAESVRLARRLGFTNIGIDLIAGLPGVTPHLWQETLDRALDLDLAHLSVYALSVEPGTLLATQTAEGLTLPGEEAQLEALAAAETRLAAAGIERYEISNYARPGLACRHNLGIWRGNDYLGLGPSAASRCGRLRWTNCADLSAYAAALQHDDKPPRTLESLSETDDAAERAVFALRLNEGLDLGADAHSAAWSDRAPAWETRLSQLAKHGITERDGTRWHLTARGREVCDAVIRELL